MRYAAGARLGPYDIVEPIGAGGMGEVYRAYDERLGRTVAIKALSSEKLLDADRRTRFIQEARAASALNHPNIVSVFDIGTEGGCDFLVMEYVPGRTLDRVIPARGLPLDQALEYATAIADALACAHAAGIVHRDIKPGNVIVGPEDQVKVLDFGLAKLMEPALGENSETRTQEARLTRDGTIVGTTAYMSPEQAAGRPVDHRSDIFALGIMLHEMVIGKRPFQGKSRVELLHAIIRDPVASVTESNASLPPELDEILSKALAKNPKDRYQHTGDLTLDLRRLRTGLQTGHLPSFRPVKAGRGRLGRWVLVVAALMVLALGAVVWRLHQLDYFWTNPMAGARLTRLTDFEGDELDAAISPDGKSVAFLSDRDGPIDAWVTQVGTGNFINRTKGQFPNLLDEYAFGLGFSADGTQLWVRGGGNVAGKPVAPGPWIMPVLGGPARPFLGKDTVNVAWSADGTRLAYFKGGASGDAIFVSEPDGAGARQVFAAKPGDHTHYPVWSPDGQYVYFIRGGVRLTQADVWRVPAAGGIAEQITHHRSDVRYPALLDARTLVYIAPAADGAGSALYSMDVERRVPHRLNIGIEQYRSVAASTVGGRRRLVASVANPSSHVWSAPITRGIAAEKDATQVTLPSVRASGPRAGPGFLLYLSSTGGDAGIWKYKDGAGVELWKPSDGATVSTPVVSFDGQQLCFLVRKNGRGALFLMTSDGTNRKALAENLDVQDDPSWSPDGQWLAVAASDGKGNRLFKVRISDGSAVVLLDGGGHYPLWSPDSRFILYRPIDGGPGIRAITPEGTPFATALPPLPFRGVLANPYRFLPDGKQIVALQGQYRHDNFWLVDLYSAEKRQLTDLAPGPSVTSFDVSPDGKSIVFDRIRQNADIVIIEPKP